ncbi:hypothetical protein RFI_16704, partial [Reticulomyxa filosa]
NNNNNNNNNNISSSIKDDLVSCAMLELPHFVHISTDNNNNNNNNDNTTTTTTCPRCEEVILRTHTHMRQHTKVCLFQGVNWKPSTVPAVECRMCHVKFANGKSLRKHIVLMHHEREKPFACAVCYRRFTLEQHMRNLHRFERKTKAKTSLFQCDICDAKFAQRYNLNRHKKEVHQKSAKYFDRLTCAICAKIFCR